MCKPSAGNPSGRRTAPRSHYDRHRPEQTTLYRLVQPHAATFFAQAEAASGGDLPPFVKDEFHAFLECGILAQGFLRSRTTCWGRPGSRPTRPTAVPSR